MPRPTGIGCLLFLFLSFVSRAQQAELMLPVTHNSPITGMAYSDDGRYLATGGADENVVKLWEVATGRLLKTISHNNPVSDISFSPGNRFLLTTGYDQHARVWEIRTGSLYYDIEFEYNNWIQKGEFTADGKHLILLADNAIEYHDLQLRKRLNLVRTEISISNLNGVEMKDSLGRKFWIEAMFDGMGKDDHPVYPDNAAISARKNLVLTAGKDSSLRLWDAATGREVLMIREDGQFFRECRFSQQADKFLALTSKNELKVWNAADQKLIRSLNGGSKIILFAEINAKGTEVITSSLATSGAYIDRWDLATGNLLQSFPLPANEYCFNIQFSPDGQWLLYFVTNGEIGLCSSGKIDQPQRINALKPAIKDQVGSVEKMYFRYVNAAFSPNSKFIASSSINTITSIYDIEKNVAVRELEGVAAEITKPKYSHNGKMLATIGTKEHFRIGETMEGVVNLWDVQQGKKILLLEGHSNRINDLAFSHDDKYLASASADGTVRIWNLNSGQTISVLGDHEKGVYKCIFTPDDRFVITQTSFGVSRIFETETGRLVTILKNSAQSGEDPLRPVKDKSIYYTQLSSDGKYVLSRYYDDNYFVSEVVTGKQLTAHNARKDSLKFITIEPTGKMLHYLRDSTIHFIELPGGRESFQINAGRYISDISFSQKGDRLACISTAGELKVFSLPAGRLLASASTKATAFSELAFTPDGKYILTNYIDSSIRVWDAETLALVKRIVTGPNEMYAFNVVRGGRHYLFTRNMSGILSSWDLHSGARLASMEDKYNSSLSYALHPTLPQLTIDNHVSGDIYGFSGSAPLMKIIPTSKNDYLVADSANRYDGTESARKLIYFTCGSEVIELDQVKEQLWVPGLGERILKGEAVNTKTLDEIGICGFTPIVEAEDGGATAYTFRITEQRGGLGETVLIVNGIEARRYQPGQLKKTGNAYVLTIQRPELEPFLVAGSENPVTVKAFTKDNRIASRGLRVNAKETGKSTEAPNLYAVVIGVSDYKGTELDLNYAAKDAVDISAAISRSARKLLNTDGKEHVFIYDLTTHSTRYALPEKKAIRNVFKEIGTKAKANDILLIFFAGHGVMDAETKMFYFLAADASQNLVGTSLKDVGISTAEMADWMQPDQVRAQKRILVLDACNSGQAIKDLVQIGGRDQQYISARGDGKIEQAKAIDRLNEKAGLFILSASASEQSAYELKDYSQGLLTYALLKAIKDEPEILESGKYLNLSRWFHAAEKTVTDISREIGARQDPQVVSNTNFNIGLVDEEVISTIILPGQKKQFTASTLQNADEEIASDDLSLNRLIDEHLAGMSVKNSALNFTFSTNSSRSDALILGGRYAVKDKTILARVNIRQGKEIKYRFEVTGTIDRLDELAEAIAEKAAEVVK